MSAASGARRLPSRSPGRRQPPGPSIQEYLDAAAAFEELEVEVGRWSLRWMWADHRDEIDREPGSIGRPRLRARLRMRYADASHFADRSWDYVPLVTPLTPREDLDAIARELLWQLVDASDDEAVRLAIDTWVSKERPS